MSRTAGQKRAPARAAAAKSVPAPRRARSPAPPLRRIFIANRGEIALRVIRTLRERGLESVAAFHAVDRGAAHVLAADHAVELLHDDPRAAYLDVALLLDAARRTGADAVHPGYGFLSEQARFARACEEAGLVFLGPRAETLEAVGNKRSAREAARRAGLPVIPGWEGAAGRGGAADAEALAAARAIGYPLLLKAVMGGGGKGMRVVRSEPELAEAFAAAAREAQASFGDPAIYFERRLDPVRHVEVQFLGDGEGNVVHLFERECSLQRRHQKVIEEAPAARMSTTLRARLTDAARAIAAAVHYRGAGTAEFLVDTAGEFYFLEVNARIQVEHPVTELVTGVDLVGLQLDVAQGLGLPAGLEPAAPRVHAIEARLYAEDPAHDFLPQSGRVAALRLPSGPGVRVDAGVRPGDEIGVHFDPLIAKICAFGPDRATAVHRLARALGEAEVAGVVTNLQFLRAVVAHPNFVAGELSTGLLERTIAPAWRHERRERALPDAVLAAAALVATEGAAALRAPGAGAGPEESAFETARAATPWDTLAGFRLGAKAGGPSRESGGPGPAPRGGP